MRHLHSVGLPKQPVSGLTRQLLAGFPTGIESCVISANFAPAHSCDVREDEGDRTLFVLTGTVTAQTAGEKVAIGENSLGLLRQGRPCVLGNESSHPATFLEILTPPTDGANGRLQTMIRPLRNERFKEHKSHAAAQGAAFSVHALADAGSGSPGATIFATMVPQGTRADPHIHAFDQFYFVLSGTLSAEVGVSPLEAPANSLVVFPAGTVHTTWNAGSEPVIALTILTPHPPFGRPRSIPTKLDIPPAWRTS